MTLKVLSNIPAATTQDFGRPTTMALGISIGGAADLCALYEGAALLGQSPTLAAIELISVGGKFQVEKDTIVAFTGAQMNSFCDDRTLQWNASHELRAGSILELSAAQNGVYSYIHLHGGIDAPMLFESRSVHLSAGIGKALKQGDMITPLASQYQTKPNQCITPIDRFGACEIHVVQSLQTHLFNDELIARFEKTEFLRSAQGNRMGVKLEFDGAGFAIDNQLNIISDTIVAGDIQMTGDGQPFVLMPDCQTIGGYPRIATIIPSDIPKFTQLPVGTKIRFKFVSRTNARVKYETFKIALQDLPKKVRPLIRDPRSMNDLLSYNLVDGVIWANNE